MQLFTLFIEILTIQILPSSIVRIGENANPNKRRNFEILIFQKNLSGQLQKCGNIVSNVCNRLLSLLRF